MTREEYLNGGAYQTAKRGMDLPQTKLTPLAIVSIRSDVRKRVKLRKEINDTLSNAALAKKWGVHVRTIESVLSYRTGDEIP